MRCLHFIFICTLFSLSAAAQDSLLNKGVAKADSTYKYSYKPLDSLQKNFHHRTDSLQKAYAAPLNKLQSSINKLQHKKDRLSKLPHPPKSVTDSIHNLQREINTLEQEKT